MTHRRLLVLFVVGCSTQNPAVPPGATPTTSGLGSSQPTASTSATDEVCDGIDNDGDGEIDEGVTETFYADNDGDFFGDPDNTVEACEAPEGYVAQAGDCNDDEPLAYDFATDTCDGIDNDCDGIIDEAYRHNWELGTLHDDGFIYIIDPVAGTITPRTALHGVSNISINSADTRDTAVSAAHDVPGSQILEFDACTGEMAHLVDTPGGNLPGIAFAPNNLLYGLDVASDKIIELDTTTGFSQDVAILNRDVINAGLAWDCANEVMWLADQAASAIQSVDPYTGALGPLIPTNVPWNAVGVEYDPRTQTLLGSTGTDLYRIDPLTGQETWLMSFGMSSINDLALLPPCP